MAKPVPTGITSPPTSSVDTSRPLASAGSEKRRKLNWPIIGGADRSGTSVVSLRFSSVNICAVAMRRVDASMPVTMMDWLAVVTTPTSWVDSYTVSVNCPDSAKADSSAGESTRL